MKINNGNGAFNNDSALKMIEMMVKDSDVDDKIVEKKKSDKKSSLIQQPIIEMSG